MLRSVDVPTPQTVNDIPYRFIWWSNGGSASQTFPTTEDDVTLTANFSIVDSSEDEMLSNQITILSKPATNNHVKLMIRTHLDQTAVIHITDVHAHQTHPANEAIQNGENEIEVFTGTLSAGIYLMSIDVDGRRYTRKVMLIK